MSSTYLSVGNLEQRRVDGVNHDADTNLSKTPSSCHEALRSDTSSEAGERNNEIDAELRSLKDFSVDDQGRRIPAPPHRDRQELIDRYHRRKADFTVLVWPFRKTQAAAQAAQKSFQLRLRDQENANDRPRTHVGSAPAFTEPLFPPLPLYGRPSLAREVHIVFSRAVSFCCTLLFLLAVILGAFFKTYIPDLLHRAYQHLTLKDPDRGRKFVDEERKRQNQHKHDNIKVTDSIEYYANLLEIDIEHVMCESMDGFTLHLQRLRDRRPLYQSSQKRYPVLLLHGLLQSAGAFCCNDEDSLAFYLCRAGFDVWLGNNRCWFKPEHSVLSYGDPRLWSWNIRQLGGLDLPALLNTVCQRTGRERVGFVGHSQGTTQTFCVLSRDQKPEIGLKMDSFCALAPAVFAGALIDKLQFRFMRVLGAKGFRIFFGIHAFIPIMMTAQRYLYASWYGHVGYLVFNFLFGWSDALWDRRLKSRFFQFSPVYVSAESMRWWMRDFAIYRSILEDTEQPWYSGTQFPPLAFWTCGEDALVDGAKFTKRINDRESEVTVVHQECITEYAHLDVLWAMDARERVGSKVKEILWACATNKEGLFIPEGCEAIESIPDPRK